MEIRFFYGCRGEASGKDGLVLFLALVAILVISLPGLLWLFGIRRYCVRYGKGYTPGANWGVTAWIDWQEATEMAQSRGDEWMRRFCKVYLTIQIFYHLIALLMILGGLLMRRI